MKVRLPCLAGLFRFFFGKLPDQISFFRMQLTIIDIHHLRRVHGGEGILTCQLGDQHGAHAGDG